MGIVITRTGKALPKLVVTNEDMAKLVDTDNQWIIDRTGIETRHIATAESNLDLAAAAATMAMNGADAASIDLVVVATVTPDSIVPCMGALVKKRLGLVNAVAFDVNAACSGFIYGIWIAQSLMSGNNFKRALVLGTERLTRITNWEDRSTCVLFGDGAGCALLENKADSAGILASFVKNYDDEQGSLSCGMEYLATPFDLPLKEEKEKMHIYMGGTQVFRFAVKAIGEVMDQVLKKAGLTPDDIACYVPHQANLRIINAAAQKFRQPIEKFQVSIRETGNVSSASVPMALHDLMTSGRVKTGDKVMLMGFGGGLSAGAVIFEV